MKGQPTLMILGYVIFALLIIGGGITAFYGLRLMGLVFRRGNHGSEGRVLKKVPSLMRISLAATLGVTAFLDFLALFLIPSFNKFLQPLLHTLTFPTIADVLAYIVPSISTVLTCVAVAVGGYPAYLLYIARRVDPAKLIAEHSFLKKVHTFIWNRFYINAFYYKIFAYPAITFSKGLYKRLEFGGIDKFNYSVAGFFRRVSKVAHERLELGGIDAFNYLIVNATTSFCRRFRNTHTGILSYNMLAFSVGLVLLMVLLLMFGGLIP